MASAGVARVELAGRHDLDAQRHQRDRDDLEIGQAQRDADDREAQRDAGGQVAQGQPPAEQDDPDDVADHGAQPGVPAHLDRAAERPQHVAGDAERRDPERDRHHQEEQHEADQPGQRVEDSHPETAQDQPDHVEDRSQHVRPPMDSPRAVALAVPLPYLKLAEQHLGGAGHRLHGLLERLRVVLGRALEPADLLDVLEGCGPDVLVGHVIGVGRAQGLDAAAHSPRL